MSTNVANSWHISHYGNKTAFTRAARNSKSHHRVWPRMSHVAELARSLIGDVIERTGYTGVWPADEYQFLVV